MLSFTVVAAETPSRAAMLTLHGPGEEQALSDIVASRPAILHFWASWCAPCLAELPALDAFKNALAAQGLDDRLVIVSVDTLPFERVRAFLDGEVGLPALESWQVARGNPGAAFGLFGYPATVLVDGNGTVVERFQGPVAWNKAERRAHFIDDLNGP